MTIQEKTIPPFHLAFPVDDLARARAFYGVLLGCPEGRSSDEWVDFNFFGHQIVAHMADCSQKRLHHNSVDAHAVPVPHFGVVLNLEDWEVLAEKLRQAGTRFVIEPYVRFKGQPGEQATMFFYDPFGNAIEIKAFASLSSLFAK
ncbi:VOC family protein [Acetobacter sp. TBRC 12305]|uniref:VOC family protein n=2 Tax=Acetobacter garciniae TaxID=2817435 RepID=A0A939HNU3_9PROT|nr:VOC family protein [Acetobacter garciniae]MBO1324439.1 VOC family protein [Acetobacter garciniae]MBX0344128.1 VOC family protein [Acetobacter garciniae]